MSLYVWFGFIEEQLDLWPVHSSMYTYFIKLLFYSLSLSEYKFQVYITFVVKVRGVKKQKIGFCFFFILSQFQISKYHEYVLIKSTISVFPRAHWHVSFFTKNNKGPLSFFSHIYLAVLSLSLPLESLRVCALWTEINSSAACLHKRLVFSHRDSFFTLLWIIKHHSVLRGLGAPKLIFPQPLCVPCDKNNIATLVL